MKDKILTALKAKFEGVSENLSSRIADKLAKTASTEEQVETAVAGLTFQQIIDSEADRRATEATQTAISNYEKKHSLKEGKPAEQGGEKKTEPDKSEDDNKDVPQWAKDLIESNKKLSEKLSSIETEKTVTSRKQKLEEVITNLPENLKKPYSRISLDTFSNEDFETFLTEAAAEVKSISDDYSMQGSVFNPPKSGSGNPKKEATKEEAAEILKLM
jgi:membrane carboxypeptidase/penicillin-binding protein